MAKNSDTPETPQEPTASEGAPQAAQQGLVVNAQYIKDLSFENPNAPGIYNELQNGQPDVRINVNVNAVGVEGNIYEVQLDMKAECQLGGKSAFIFELVYAGIFTVNVPEEHVQPVLLIECPRLLFPFARNIMADVTRDGGFPPVMLGPVDFMGMYQARLKEMQEQQGGEKKDA